MWTIRRDAIKEGNLGKMNHVIPYDSNEPIVSFSSADVMMKWLGEEVAKYQEL